VLKPALPPLHTLNYEQFDQLVQKLRKIVELQTENFVENAKEEREVEAYEHFNEVVFFTSKRDWRSISPHFWCLFYLLSQQDLEKHAGAYESQLAKLKTEIAELKVEVGQTASGEKKQAAKELERA